MCTVSTLGATSETDGAMGAQGNPFYDCLPVSATMICNRYTGTWKFQMEQYPVQFSVPPSPNVPNVTT